MSELLTCSCGARLRLPESPGGAAGSIYRCPRCKTTLEVPGESVSAGLIDSGQSPLVRPLPMPPPLPPAAFPGPLPVSPPPLPVMPLAPAPLPRPPVETPPSAPATGVEVGAMCPICQVAVAEGELVVTCPECQQLHHQECWIEVGGCAIYGCKKAPAVAKDSAAATQAPLSAWGDNKTCPVCGQRIKSIAVKCRYCGTEFGTVDPLTSADLRDRIVEQQQLGSLRTGIVVLFALSMIGLLAPILAIVSLCWVLPKRKLLGKAGPVYLILGYGSIGLSVLYSLLMLVFMVAS